TLVGTPALCEQRRLMMATHDTEQLMAALLEAFEEELETTGYTNFRYLEACPEEAREELTILFNIAAAAHWASAKSPLANGEQPPATAARGGGPPRRIPTPREPRQSSAALSPP